TGISAFTAFLEALKPENPRQVWLVYGARHAGLLLFQEMILEQLARVHNFHALFFTESEDASLAARMAALPHRPACLTGRLAVDLFKPRVSDFLSRVFYLSGPPIMLTSLIEQLRAQQVPPDHIRTDAWE
ncbi:MAG: hypothetical protein NTW03_20835, partial [Verrucomicrobia bacterium]|nr:hypothetical protein [Verrucomicrobiota bacterium]